MELQDEITEYNMAFKAHLDAQKRESLAKLEVQASRERLHAAKDALASKEKELLNDVVQVSLTKKDIHSFA